MHGAHVICAVKWMETFDMFGFLFKGELYSMFCCYST